MKKREKVEEIKKSFTLFHDIQKVDAEQRIVGGYAVVFEEEDPQGDIFTKAAVEGALDDYLRRGNPTAPRGTGPMRVMHQPKVAGSIHKAFCDDTGLWVEGFVTDDQEWEKVKKGDYIGFSVGGYCRERQGKRITKMKMIEISLADRPVQANSRFQFWKADLDIEAAEEIPAKPLDPQDPELQKNLGTYAISRLSDIIGSLNSFRDFYIVEEKLEGDTSPVPKMLLRSIAGLGRILRTIVREEMKELVEGPDEPEYPYGEEIEMAKNEDGTASTLTREDVAGIVAAAIKADREEQAAIRKAEVEAQERTQLQKERDELIQKNAELDARIKALEANQPLAPRASAAPAVITGGDNTVVAKAEDAGQVGGSAAAVIGGILDPEKATTEDLFKAALKVGALATPNGMVPFIRQ